MWHVHQLSVPTAAEAIILVSCSDHSGIVARVTNCLHETGRNILNAAQHTDFQSDRLLQRLACVVTRVSHRDSVQDMVRKGRDIERAVLARAVRWYLEDRVIEHNGRAIVFA